MVEALTSANIRNMVLWDVLRVVWQMGLNVSVEPGASIHKVKKASSLFNSEDGDRFLRTVDTYLFKYIGLYPRRQQSKNIPNLMFAQYPLKGMSFLVHSSLNGWSEKNMVKKRIF
jgi:hypothetical protein